MRAGDLDRKIVIQSFTETQDAYGAPVKTWAAFATVWAQVRPVRGREGFEAEQVAAQILATFRIRYLAGVLLTMRISYDGKVWNLRSINEIGRREGLEIEAEVERA